MRNLILGIIIGFLIAGIIYYSAPASNSSTKAKEYTTPAGAEYLFPDIWQTQTALQQMGYDLGPTGIDGEPGKYTWGALKQCLTRQWEDQEKERFNQFAAVYMTKSGAPK